MFKRAHTWLVVIALALAAGGCVDSTTRFNWGPYSDGLYRYYHDPASAERVRSQLVRHIQALEKSGALVPPGLYAEVGTYFLDAGDSQTAVEYYRKEYDAWPESRSFMSALIQNLEK